MNKLKAIFHKHRELILYLLFGGLTTAVNWLVYFPLYNLLAVDAAVSNVIAWAVSVTFAFLTNKPFVFCSYDWHLATVLPELAKFVSARLLSGALETLGLFLLVTRLGLDGNLVKILIGIAVVIINYIASKLLIFKH